MYNLELPLWAKIIVFVAFLYSVILHEIAHGYSAFLLGDPTAYAKGRLSFNPIVHIDPFMTILMPLMLYYGSNGRFAFGGAKPVPVNPYRFKNLNKGMMITAIAGPLVNIVLALIFALACRGVDAMAPANGVTYNIALTCNILFYIGMLNIVLAAFNMIPIPPLDGSRILRYFLPRNVQTKFDSLEQYGMFLVIIVVMTGVHRPVLQFVIEKYAWFINL